MSESLRAWRLFANKNSELYQLRKHRGSFTPFTRDCKLSLMLKGQDRYERTCSVREKETTLLELAVVIYEEVINGLDRTMAGSVPAAFSTLLPSGCSCLRCHDSK